MTPSNTRASIGRAVTVLVLIVRSVAHQLITRSLVPDDSQLKACEKDGRTIECSSAFADARDDR
jgi:hypothetical protein